MKTSVNIEYCMKPSISARFAGCLTTGGSGFASAAVVVVGVNKTATAQIMAAAKARFFFSMVFLLSVAVAL
jgi:hypothetical protein